MIRRSFRVGLWLGITGGIVFALVKAIQSRRPAPAVVQAPVAVPGPAEPAPPTPTPIPAPVPEPPPADPKQPPVPEPTPMRATPSPAKKSAPVKRAAKKVLASWVDPDGRVCPPSHPVKAKLASRIFHLPGGLSYERTIPDRCYESAAGAEADGLRPAKR